MSPAQQMPQSKNTTFKTTPRLSGQTMENVQVFFVSVNSQKRPDYKEYQAQCNKSLFNAGQNCEISNVGYSLFLTKGL